MVYERDSFGYTVNYYSRDHAGQESFLGSTTGPAATYGSTVTVPVEQLNAKLPTGFKALEAGADYTVDITADEAQNVIDVTYEPDTFTYTIRYYHDAALDDAYHFQGEPLVGEAVYGSTVHVDIHTLNRNIPDEGFYPKDNDDEFDIVITEDAAANSYNVVYERASYAYTIAYYKDSWASARASTCGTTTATWPCPAIPTPSCPRATGASSPTCASTSRPTRPKTC